MGVNETCSLCAFVYVHVCIVYLSDCAHLYLYHYLHASLCVCASPVSMTTMESSVPPAPFNQSSTMVRLKPPYLYTIRLERIAALLSTTK